MGRMDFNISTFLITKTLRNARLGVLLLGLLPLAQPLFAQCTPTSASLCASGDDLTTVYVGGSLLGTFNYAGAPGTN